MQVVKIHKMTPHLWFDKEAKEAAEFYTSAFKGSRIKDRVMLHGSPSGDSDLVTIDLMGQEFMLISAGPYFKFNPSVSFVVALDTKDEVDALWKTLSAGGSALMELGSYPFSERYGWVQDKYGVSWQLIYLGSTKVTQRIVPTLMFVGDRFGKAEEAINFYASIFRNSKVGSIVRYDKGEEPNKEGTVKHGWVLLEGYELGAMDGALQHSFTFNEAVSFIVYCKDQQEIDYYWDRLSAVPEAEQCGWLKDKFGVSWQIVPVAMGKMMRDKDEAKIARVTEAFLKMKKFDIATLERAYKGPAKASSRRSKAVSAS